MDATDSTDATDEMLVVDKKKVNSPANIFIPDTSLDALTLDWCDWYDWYDWYNTTWHGKYSKLHLKISITSNAHSSGQGNVHYYGLVAWK